MIETKSRSMSLVDICYGSVEIGILVSVTHLLASREQNTSLTVGIISTGLSAAIFSGIKLSDYLREKRGRERL